jgi:hypothetical protein
MRLRAFALMTIGVALLAACGGKSYPTNKGDDDYKLDEMALKESDLPGGVLLAGTGSFDENQWAQTFDPSDENELQQRVTQLEAQGWLKNFLLEAGTPGNSFGKVLGVKSLSTLYKTADDAKESISRFGCGLPIGNERTTDFYVPKLGDQSSGFFVPRPVTDDVGQTVITFVDTVVCFRTGRIVHAVQETSIQGIEDVSGPITLAEKMLRYANDSFDGKGVAPTPGPEDDQGPG